jgi:hypothetical protein
MHMTTTNLRTDGLVIVLFGPGAGGDADGWGIRNGRIIHIPGNNPELRNLVAATRAVNAVQVAGENAELAALGKAAQAAMLEAGAKVAAGVR